MAYVVLARRWRPQKFAEIIGQEHVSKTLTNAIETGRIAHSFIFAGPRGVGKTTAARILAKALNCQNGPIPIPCDECSNCKSITTGNSMDVLEIDGASNRGIDEIRNLRENIRFAPSQGKYRIYIIDEVHMLTKEAFNALLKTLEEPPSHVVFIFATTEIHRVPPTILSRCQRFDFKRIPTRTIMDHLRYICKEDKIEIDDEALFEIAKKGDGSMRDSQSILDQIIAYGGGKVDAEMVKKALGIINLDLYFDFTGYLLEKNVTKILEFTQQVFNEGIDLGEFLSGLEEHFRNLLIAKTLNSTEFVTVAENFQSKYIELGKEFNQNDLLQFVQMSSELQNSLKWASQPHIKFEVGMLKMVNLPSALEIQKLLEQAAILKKKTINKPAAPQKPEPAPVEHAAESPPVLQFSQESLISSWTVICGNIGKIKPMLGTSLELGSAEVQSEKELKISFENQHVFQYNLALKNLELIEQEVNGMFGSKIQIEFVVDKNKKPVHTEKRKNKKEILEEISSEDPLIDKLIDEFGLEIS